METCKHVTFVLLLTTSAFMFLVYMSSSIVRLPTPSMLSAHNGVQSAICPSLANNRTITALPNTPHLLVSAFADRRQPNFDVRIIAIFRRDLVHPLRCVFCCGGAQTSPAKIVQHTDHFGYAYVTTDVLCRVPQGCRASHVTLVRDDDPLDGVHNSAFLPIRNQESGGTGPLPKPGPHMFNLTVCISTLFGSYNNVLQFTQSLEMYR